MEFAGIIFIITLILQSYILADKNHIENIKIYRYVINMIVLLLVGFVFYTTADNTEKFFYMKGNYFVIIFLIVDILSILEWYYIKNNSTDNLLIKNTIDNADSGIMTISNIDKIMFQNSSMYNLISDLEIHNDYISNIKNKAVQKIGNDYIIEKNNKATLFRFSNNEEEITAYDISEEYALQKKLKQNLKRTY